MASGMGGGLMNIVWIIIVLWIVIELGFPLFKRLLGEVKDTLSLRARAYPAVTTSYM